MIERKLESTIFEMLKSFRIVAINGPRQSGKTTLQKKIAKVKGMKYYTFCKFHFILPPVSLPAFHFFNPQTSI